MCEYKRVLVLDPAASTGYVLFKVRTRSTGAVKAQMYAYGHIDVDTSSDFQGDHCIDLTDKIESLMEEHLVDCVALEDYFFSRKFVNGSSVNAAYRTAIHILCRKRGLPYTILNVSLWKTYVAGRSTPTKEQKKRWGPKAKKYFIQEALWKSYQIRFPNYALSNKNRRICFRSDVVDAVAMGIYFCKMILKVDELGNQVDLLDDDPKVKGGFRYDDSK